MRRSDLIFHPLSVLLFGLLATVSYAAYVRWRFPLGDLSQHYFYVLPIIVPFVAFLFSRAREFRSITALQLIIDATVVGLSLMRMFDYLPLISGHVLFLSYAVSGPGSRLTRVTAALVMLQVIYLKFLVWHDPVSPFAGALLGLTGATIVWLQKNRRRRVPHKSFTE